MAASVRALTGAKWEDEYLTIVLSLPLVAVVVPGAGAVISSGFDALGHAPDWYVWSVEAAMVYAFGKAAIRRYRHLVPQQRQLKGAI